jgi:LacI family transcriptional regulator
MNGFSARPDTELRVRAAIADLGYQPNSAARALKVRESDQICLSFADIGNPAYVSMTRGVGRILHESKYRLVLASSFSTVGEIIKQLESMGRGYADGLIISPIYSDPEITELISQLKMPVVLIGTMPDGLDVDNVHIDSSLGIKLAATHLKQRGRSKIGLLNGPLNTNPGRRRSEGFRKVLKSLKLSFNEEQIIQADDFTSQSGYDAISKFQDLSEIDGLICGNDLMAAGALRFLSEKGIDVPSDIAVVGIDNTELASLVKPTLTSVDLLAEERGELAAKLLLDRIANPKRAPKKIVVQPKLIVRGSS